MKLRKCKDLFEENKKKERVNLFDFYSAIFFGCFALFCLMMINHHLRKTKKRNPGYFLISNFDFGDNDLIWKYKIIE